MKIATAAVVLMILTGLIIGAGVPVALFYMALKAGASGLLIGVVTLISIVAVGAGAKLARDGFEPVFKYVDQSAEATRRQLDAHRAFMRSLLEELDEVNALLKDIRDELKKVGT